MQSRRLLLGALLISLIACGSVQPPLSQTTNSNAATAPSDIAGSPSISPPDMTPTTTVPPTNAPPVDFFRHPSLTPIVAHGDPIAWDAPFTDPGAVIFHDGQFHMFRNGFRAWPGSVQIGYVTSSDGQTWTKQGNEPVLRTNQVPFAGTAALASDALVQDDGTWVLFFTTWNAKERPASGVIGRATAPQPTGPWTVDPTPLLQPGTAGTWDERHVFTPNVLRTASGYVMYYTGSNRDDTQMIGRATSTDGRHWTKYDDPATTTTAFAHSDPVLSLGTSGAWDALAVHQARVIRSGDHWELFYRGMSARTQSKMALGYATSQDGIHWTRFAHNPVLTAAAINRRNFYMTNLIEHASTYYLFWEVETDGQTNIHLAIHTGPITP